MFWGNKMVPVTSFVVKKKTHTLFRVVVWNIISKCAKMVSC